MIFNPFAFLIGRTIALNRGVANNVATSDGLIGGVVRPPVLGVVLVSAISQNQARSVGSGPGPVTTSAPTLTAATVNANANTMTLAGTNFGSDVNAITVTFSWTGGSVSATSPQVTQATNTAITLTVPGGIPPGVSVTLTVSVRSSVSNPLTLTARGTAANIAVTSGNSQRQFVNTAFDAPLVAVVTDAWGSFVNNVPVTFAAPPAGVSGTFDDTGNNTTTQNTNANGQATSTMFAANATAGPYLVAATAPGVPNPAYFQLTNLQNPVF